MRTFNASKFLGGLLLATSVAESAAFHAVSPLLSTSVTSPPPPLFAVAQRNQRRGPQQRKNDNTPMMNDEIKYPEVRVMAPNPAGKDEPLGIMPIGEARTRAAEMGNLDLIVVNPNSEPPVCKIVDYSKYRYMQEKKAKEIKKNSKVSELKEVKMSYKIDVHDYGVRKKNALKFLRQGNRVKTTVMFRGREMQHNQLGAELLERLAEELIEIATKEGGPKREGRNLSLILSPRPEVMRELSNERKAQEKAKKLKKFAAEGTPVNGEVRVPAAESTGENERPSAQKAKPTKANETLDKLLGGEEFF